jgi:rod shape determining protein RodA
MVHIFASRPQPISILDRLARINWPMILVLLALAGIGVVSLYSVADGRMTPWAERHALRFLLALAMLIVIALMPLRVWTALAYPTYVVALLLLALVPLIGTEAMGARRWLQAGGVSFQPSELMKVALVAMLARYYQWLPPDKVSKPLYVLVPLLAIAAPVALTLRQPDLGTAVLFASVGLGLMFLAGVSLLYFLAGIGSLAALLPMLWSQLHDYQRRRVDVFLNPELDPLGAGYHISQSKIALGSGGLSGKGFMQGTQAGLDFLPEKQTDFIFTMFAEEWGYVGAVGLLSLYALLLTLIVAMALRCRGRFGRLLISGAALILFLYVFINVAMVTGLVPVVGVPLPFVSYGGTSLVTLMFALGLAMCAYVNCDETFRRDEIGRWF